jgi:glucokinase
MLVGDIGGTKSLLARAETNGVSVALRDQQRFDTRRFEQLGAMIAAFTDRGGPPVEAACLGVPGPVVDAACRTPNLPWIISESEIEARTGIGRVVLVNDFEATAAGVPSTPPEDLVPLQAGTRHADGIVAVLGPGTGLGEAILVPDGTRHRVLPSEAGHADFAPQGDLQRALAADIEGSLGHLSVERVLSGPGIVRIYEFLAKSGMPEASEVLAADPGDRPGVITRLALDRSQPTCEQALDVFVRILGAEAGNLALRALARGGVVVAGGIAPRVLPRLREGGFIAAFLAKGRLQEFLRQVPVVVCTDPAAPLRGAALIGHERMWRRPR